MGELREVMIQYANCADPSESAARKERLRLAEEHGQFEETAEQMVRASLSVPAGEDVNAGSPDFSSSHERIPVALRLGPTNPPPKPKKRAVTKRKPGRPPLKQGARTQGKKAGQPSPKIPPGGRSKKRKMLLSQATPRRRLIMDPLAEPATLIREAVENVSLPAVSGSISGRPGQAPVPTSTGSMDFRNPTDLLP